MDKKKVLIISPHFPPSNLAAVHRTRLFVQHLPSLGWEPIVLTVHEDFYEEQLDWNLNKLIPVNLRVEKSKAFPVTKPRTIGDIGLRGFFQLYRNAKELIKKDKIDFLYIPIPSFYAALLGRWLHASTGVKYGIDYIDPWVHHSQFGDKIFSRHWVSEKIANFLEPIAVKDASLITGVAEGYYKGVQERNPHLLKQAIFAAMPYGGEESDHEKVKDLDAKPYIFTPKQDKIQMVYAGAMLPKAYEPLEAVFEAIRSDIEKFRNVEFYFIGTGKSPNDPDGFNIKPIAEKYGLWQTIVFEHPQRIPYLDVLIHLENADGVFILGSTEPHYTPSKVYQGVLSGKYIFSILHQASTAVKVIKESKAGIVLSFDGERGINTIREGFSDLFTNYLERLRSFDPSAVNKYAFEEYSAKAVTAILANSFNQALSK